MPIPMQRMEGMVSLVHMQIFSNVHGFNTLPSCSTSLVWGSHGCMSSSIVAYHIHCKSKFTDQMVYRCTICICGDRHTCPFQVVPFIIGDDPMNQPVHPIPFLCTPLMNNIGDINMLTGPKATLESLKEME